MFGGGVASINFFSTGLSQFSHSCKLGFVVCILLLQLRTQKKINPSNLKHKMSTFVLVRLNVISRLESYHFPKLWLVIEAHVLKSRGVGHD